MSIPQGAIRINIDSNRLEFYAEGLWHEIETHTPNLDGGARGIAYRAGANNDIEFITIPTQGNATDFGDLLAINAESTAASSETRGLCAGGETPTGGGWTNVIQYVSISTTGNAVDFGDLTVARGNDLAGFSDVHGGLG